MSLERMVSAFAGFMVLLSVLLTQFVHPGFIWLTVFVGANLFQQSFTGFCPAAMVMRKLGARSERELAIHAKQRTSVRAVANKTWDRHFTSTTGVATFGTQWKPRCLRQVSANWSCSELVGYASFTLFDGKLNCSGYNINKLIDDGMAVSQYQAIIRSNFSLNAPQFSISKNLFLCRGEQ